MSSIDELDINDWMKLNTVGHNAPLPMKEIKETNSGDKHFSNRANFYKITRGSPQFVCDYLSDFLKLRGVFG